MTSLTGKQHVFVEEYLRCLNATEAARRAGYQGNDFTLASVGYENLRKPQIASAISKRLQEIVMSADEALARLAEQARGEHGRYITPEGQVDIERIVEDGKGYLIKAIRPGKYGDMYEFYDSQNALVQICKHHGLLIERTDLTTAGQPLKGYISISPDDWPAPMEKQDGPD